MRLTVLALLMLCHSSVAWDVDKRCPNWRDGRRRRRQLQQNSGGLDVSDADFDMDAYDRKQRESLPLSSSPLLLRSSQEEQSNHHRELAFSFQMKLYWEQGFCWQEEWKERKWCMSCQGTCSRGERLWIQYCQSGDMNQRFEYIPRQGGGQLKTATANLCLELVSGSSYKLADCQVTANQIFTGFEMNAPFELHPQTSPNTCMANDFHHPKPDEFIYGSICRDARINNTNRWQVYNGGSDVSSPLSPVNPSTLRLRNEECSDNNKCDVCEGDCDSDQQCRGDLKCFQRNGVQAVPGCMGSGTSGSDYCYEPTTAPVTATNNPQVTTGGSGATLTNTAMTNIFGRLRGPGCSRNRPCGLCHGDCDNDDECAGNLICYQKAGPGNVPGCSGYDVSNSDFCVPPWSEHTWVLERRGNIPWAWRIRYMIIWNNEFQDVFIDSKKYNAVKESYFLLNHCKLW